MSDAASTTDTVTLDVAIESADYVALMKYLVRGPQKSLMFKCRLLTSAALCTLLVLAAVDRPFWAFAVAYAALFVLAINARILRNGRFKVVEDAFTGHFTADAEGLTVQRPGISSRMLWRAYEEIVVTPERLILRLTSASAHLIPTRCFARPDDLERFLAFARAARIGVTLK